MTTKKKRYRQSLATWLNERFSKVLGATSFSDDLPKKWEKHGDLILLPESCFQLEIWRQIDSTDLLSELAKYFGVARIAKKGRICSDCHRTPQVEMLLGVDTWVCHTDNKIKYCYDVTKCMFSVGNITEKMRMANLQCSDEVIVDMFAGIGYFTLPLLVHAKARHIHSCEWNSNAVEALKRNLRVNKVDGKCTVYEGDNRKVCPTDIADRVIMGLIPNAMGSIEPACRALRHGKGGVLHIHHNVESNVGKGQHCSKPEFHESDRSCAKIDSSSISCNKRTVLPEWLSWATETALTVKEVMRNIHDPTCAVFETRILHIEKVKSYAPHIDHMVLDLKVEPCNVAPT